MKPRRLHKLTIFSMRCASALEFINRFIEPQIYTDCTDSMQRIL
jgi:hypothetical protein